MKYLNIPIEIKGHEGELRTYIIDNSDEIDKNRKRPMVIICPGGAYAETSDREAEPIALQLMAMGIHCAILRYSVNGPCFPLQVGQLAKTVALVREKAKEWFVDTDKVVVMGFSAGGHLAASLGVFWNESFLQKYTGLTADMIKPNGMVLSYPVISSGEFGHRRSMENLLGKKAADHVALEKVSLEKQVDKNTPKTFIWHTASDSAVLVENSLFFASALRKNGVPFEMHIYPDGDHGISLANEETTRPDSDKDFIRMAVQNWIQMAGRWIKDL